jgi:hypothetical protein
MQDLHAMFFNSNIVLVVLNFFCVDFGKPFKMRFKIISIGHNMKKILLIKFDF